MPMSEETKKQFEREKQAYWQQRDQLLSQYPGKWVAVVDGKVVAAASQMNKAASEAFQKVGPRIMYVTLVGKEDIVLRVRNTAAGYYDLAYPPPLPMVTASVSDLRMSSSTPVAFVVDTGADVTLLRQDVADLVDLWNDPGGQMQVGGIGGTPEVRQLYNAWVHIAGQPVLVTADCRDDLDEDILGRDVINDFSLTVCAKRDEVRFEWVDDAQP